MLLLCIAVWLAFRMKNQGQSSWRGAIILGLLVAGLLFLQSLNDWPLWSAGYDTNASYPGFVLAKIGMAVVFLLLTALTVTLVLPAAAPLYRASPPVGLLLSPTFPLPRLLSED